KRNKTIAKVLTNERGQLIDTAELKLRSAVLNSERWAIALVLRTIGKERGYSEHASIALLDLFSGKADGLHSAMANGDAKPLSASDLVKILSVQLQLI